MRRSEKWSSVVALTLVAAVASARVDTGGRSMIVARQDPSPTSINWWPYPAYPSWDAGTTVTAAPDSVTAASSFIAAVSPTTDETVTGSSTSTQSSTISAPSTSGTTIHITALPPASTPRRNIRRSNSSSFKIVYLAPVFAVVGVLVGVLLTWLIFCLARGRLCGARQRGSSLQAGPKYEAPPVDAGNVDTDSETSSGSRFLGVMRQGKKSLRESMLSRNSTRSSWLRRGPSSRTPNSVASAPQRSVSHGTAERGDASTSHMEDDPFLPPSSRTIQAATAPAPLERHQTSRSSLSGSPFGSDVFSDNEDEAAPYDTLRHKSIRRVILERLKHGSRYRGGHKRADSDVTVDEVRARGGAYTPVSLHADRSPSRMSGTSRSSAAVVCDGPSSPGFRLVQAEPSPDPTQEGGLLGLNWSLPWIASPDKLNAEDRFTPVPFRRSPMDKRGSPLSPTPKHSRAASSSSLKISVVETSQRPALPRVDSSVLPTSPPRVTSPPMEAQLFFGTIPQKFGATPQLELNFPPATKSPSGSPSASGSPRKKTRKLHTQRTPPLLPFPASGKSSPYTQRLTKSKPHAATTSERQGSPPSTPTKAQRSEGRSPEGQGAHSKINQILAKSWSARDMRGEERVGSPNMFGAVTDTDGMLKGGIEHRLLG